MRMDINPGERCETAAEGAALGLLGLMSGISEECWCAGWLIDLEFRLWDAQASLSGNRCGVTERQATLLRLLAEECDGRWHWKEDSENPQFMPLEEWVSIFENRKREVRSR